MYKILFATLLILGIFSLSHFVFEPMDLYFILPNLDIPMHILGGFAFGLFFISIFEYRSYKFTLLNIMLLVLFVGIVWEVYEWVSDIINLRTYGGWVDTVKDIFDDMLGAYLSFKICQKSK
jgi:hypothetical protein